MRLRHIAWLNVLVHAAGLGMALLMRPGTPLVRVVVVSLFAGVDVWRVPRAWTQRSLGDVIRGIRSGLHRELEP